MKRSFETPAAFKASRLDELLPAVQAFLDVPLRGSDGAWDPAAWAWRVSSAER